jgi:hypothetical protein
MTRPGIVGHGSVPFAQGTPLFTNFMRRHSDTLITQGPRGSLRGRHGKRFSGSLRGNGENGSEEAAPRCKIHRLNCLAQPPPKSLMRVLLRNSRTMKFFRSEDRWTKDPTQARDFHSGWGATVYAFTMNPRDLEIHYEFDDERYDMDISVLGQSTA